MRPGAMGPPGTREALAAAIAGAGCQLREDPELGGFVAVDCPTPLARARLVTLGAWRDARYDGRIRQLAIELVRAHVAEGGGVSPLELAALVQRAVAERVQYIGEAGDVIQNAWTTWETGLGDCDCQARLVLALLRAIGIACELVCHMRGCDVRHVCAVVASPDGVQFLETTLGPAARFGEHPFAAARRLGSRRKDLGAR